MRDVATENKMVQETLTEFFNFSENLPRTRCKNSRIQFEKARNHQSLESFPPHFQCNTSLNVASSVGSTWTQPKVTIQTTWLPAIMFWVSESEDLFPGGKLLVNHFQMSEAM